MRSCRSEIERLLPVLRQVARALVEKHRTDIADDLVHEALDEAIRGERAWTANEIETRLYARMIGANRLRLRSEEDERRSLPGVSAQGDAGPMRTTGAGSPARGNAQGFDSLALGDREALLLVVLGRLDYPKAADILGVPVSTLIARLTHARDTLGTALWSTPAAALPKPPGRASGSYLRLVKS